MIMHTKKNQPNRSRYYNEIKKAMNTANDLYNKLVLVVGKNGSGKTAALKDVAKDEDIEIINVNLLLSSELLELSTKDRRLQVAKLLGNIIEKDSSCLFLDNTEILFDKDLKQDPLRLLKNLSRNRLIVASWNGEKIGNKLLYAEVNHPEYQSYELKDECVVAMEQLDT